MSITAIQQSESLFGITQAERKNRSTASQPTSSGSTDTVQFSEEALALFGKSRQTDGKDETESLFDETTEATETTPAKSIKEMGKSLFSIMLESLFLADLEESAKATAQTAEDGMPKKAASPLEDSGKVAELKKLMNDVATGKADLSDLPKAMATGSGGSGENGSAAAKKTGKAGNDPEKLA